MTRPMDLVRVWIAPGADLSADPSGWPWVNVTHLVDTPFTATVGYRGEDVSSPTSGEATLPLLNFDGDLSPPNPLGEWFGLLDVDTPLMIDAAGVDEPVYEGFISELPTAWRVYTERVEHARSQIKALGMLDWLDSRDDLDSAIFRATVRNPDVVAYWPCEEHRDASVISSPIPGVQPILPLGVEFGSGQDLPAGSQPRAVRVAEGTGGVIGGVPNHPSTDRYAVAGVVKADEVDGSDRDVLNVFTTGRVVRWRLSLSTSGARLTGAASDGSLLVDETDSPPSAPAAGRSLLVTLELQQDGEDLDWSYSLLTADASLLVAHSDSGTVSTAALGQVTRAGLGPGRAGSSAPDRYVSHLIVSRASSGHAIDTAAVHGYTGERAGRRFERLCHEEGLRCYLYGDPDTSARMGPQLPTRLGHQFTEIAATEQGRLGEHRFGVTLRLRDTLYNQDDPLTVDINRLLASDLTGQWDGQRRHTDVTVSRPSGSSARVDVTPEGGRRRQTGLSANPADDTVLALLAAWQTHLGTTRGYRWPMLPLRVSSNMDLLPDLLALRSGDRLRVQHPLPQLPSVDIDVVVEGKQHTIDSITWDIGLVCSLAPPFQVWELEHDVRGRLHPTRSVLAGDVNAGATAWAVSTEGPPWINSTDHSDQLPLQVRVGGEVVQVTGITSPDTGEAIVGAGNAREDTGTTSHVAPSVEAPASSLLVCGWCSYGGSPSTYTVPGGMTAGQLVQGDNFADMITATQAVSAGATGTRTATYSVPDRYSAVSVVLQGLTGAPTVEEDLAGYSSKASGDVNPGLSLMTDVSTEAGWWLVAIHGWDWDPNDAMGEVSGAGGPWRLVADSVLTTWETSRVRAWVRRVSAPGVQEVHYPGAFTPWDVHARLLVISGVVDVSGQVFTVTRGVNGITKPHKAGSEVELASPHVIAL